MAEPDTVAALSVKMLDVRKRLDFPSIDIPPPCQTRKMVALGQFRDVSSTAGVGGKFMERAAYILRFHGRYARQESIIKGQFREISSAGGVGRKYKEGSKSKRIYILP